MKKNLSTNFKISSTNNIQINIHSYTQVKYIDKSYKTIT